MEMPPSAAVARHWDAAHETHGVSGVSWFQIAPTVSWDLFEVLGVSPGAAIIDIGGGSPWNQHERHRENALL